MRRTLVTVATTARRLAVTLSFLAACIVVAVWLECLTPAHREAGVLAASTNLDNLSHGHLLTLITSAFFRDSELTLLSVIGLGAVLGVAELRWGHRRMATVFAGGHIGATLLVAAGLALGAHHGWVPDSWRAATDVGVSYGVVAIAGALTGEWPSELRPLWAFGWLAVLGTELAVGRTFTQAGHLCALLLGFAAAGWLRRRGSGARRAPIGLLATGSAALAVGQGGLPWWVRAAAAAVATVGLVLLADAVAARRSGHDPGARGLPERGYSRWRHLLRPERNTPWPPVRQGSTTSATT